MAKEELFSFIPERQLSSKSSDPIFRVSITAGGMLYFPRDIVEMYDLDKKFFKFYGDVHKKAIAWRATDSGTLSDLAGFRKLGIVNNGAGQISIQKLLSAIGVKELKGSISGIPVKTYKGQGYLEEEVNYVIVNEKQAKERKPYTRRKEDRGSGLDGESGTSASGEESSGGGEEAIPAPHKGGSMGDQEE